MEECVHVFGRDPHVYQTTVKAVRGRRRGQSGQPLVTVDLAACL